MLASVRRLASEMTLKESRLAALNDDTLLFALGQVTSEARVIESHFFFKLGTCISKIPSSCFPLGVSWAVTGWALIKSKVDWKQILRYNHALGAQDGPLISGRLPSVAQPHGLTCVGTGDSLLGLRNKFSPNTEVGLLTQFGDARSEAVFLVCTSREGNQDWSPCPLCWGL